MALTTCIAATTSSDIDISFDLDRPHVGVEFETQGNEPQEPRKQDIIPTSPTSPTRVDAAQWSGLECPGQSWATSAHRTEPHRLNSSR
jgi:hypothetical protein